MKTKLLVWAAAVVFLSACSDIGSNSPLSGGVAETGSIAFRLAKNTIPSEVGILEVRMERDGYDPITSTTVVENFIDTVRITLSDIPVGDWLLTIDAKDSAGHLLYTGSTSVTIIENQTVLAFVHMNSVGGGTGSIQINVVWQGSPKLGEAFTLSFGQSISIQNTDLKLKFTTLLEESRCPEGLMCFWEGNAKIALEVNHTQIVLNTALKPRETLYQRYKIALMDLSPYPKIGDSINVEEYMATLLVTDVDEIIMFNPADSVKIGAVPAVIQDSIFVSKGILYLKVSYSGCSEHDFALYGSSLFLKSNPPQAEIFLSHEKLEPCDGWFTTDVRCNLSPLMTECRKQFGSGQILLRIYPPGSSDPVQPLVPVSF